MSETIYDLVGYSAEEWVNGGWELAIHPEDHTRVLAGHVGRLAGASVESLEYRLLSRSGAVVWVRDEAMMATDGEDQHVLLGALVDITRQKDLEMALQASEDRFFSAFDDAGVPLGISDLDGRILRVNRPHCELVGYDESELIGLNIQSLIVSEEREQAQFARDDLIAGRIRSAQIERHFQRKDGSISWVIVTLSMLRDGDGQPIRILAQLQDIGGQRRTEAALREADQRYRTLIERTPDIITRIDRDFRHLSMNPAAERVIGLPADRWIGHTARELDLPQPLCDTIERLVTYVVATGAEAIDEFRHVGDGMPRDFEIQVIPEPNGEDGKVVTVLAVIREATERVLVWEHLRYQASHDALTGLLNRRGFLDHLGRALATSPANAASPAVLFIDLDDFKVVNDNLGHAAGDQVLIDVAGRLATLVHNPDAVARLGGDEFAVLVDAQDARAAATTLARRILQSFNYPFVANRTTVEVRASIGIAVRLAPLDQPTNLLRWADIAMYQAKADGKHRFVIFEPTHHPDVATRSDWELALRHAIETDELTIAYQPVVDLKTGAVVAREALARWSHPRLGVALPETFVPFADEVGLGGAFTAWVLRRACSDAANWLDSTPSVIVNLSSRQFHDATLVETVTEVLNSTGFPPSRMMFDVNEQALMYHAEIARERITALAAVGVQIAIDNVGSGYTSLGCLTRCEIRTLRIDRMFIAGLPGDSANAALVASVIGLARPLGLKVVAVGVETTDQADWLRALGCDQAQGYAFGEPVAGSDLV